MLKVNPKAKTHHTRPRSKHLIGVLSEKSLHSALKDWYARPGDRFEVEVDGFHIDIKRHNLLIEIQTTNFSTLKRKLSILVEKHPLRLVYPIPEEKWIVRLDADGISRLGRRKSPKKGNIFQLFHELVSIPDLIGHPNFSLEVLLIQEEEIRCNDGNGSWRRKGLSIRDRRLIGVLGRYLFTKPAEFLMLLPQNLQEPFSTRDLADYLGQPRWLSQKMAYCLRHMGIIKITGKKGNARLYSSEKPLRESEYPSPHSLSQTLSKSKD